MKPLEEIYGRSFFNKRHKFEWRAGCLADSFEKLVPNIASYVDVGCATGDLVREMQRRGYHAVGIEGSRHCWEFRVTNSIIIHDIRMPLSIPKSSLCSCLEVMEHIEEEYADILVENLTGLSDLIVTSAAPPGQKGHHHVNCQPLQYWENKFLVFGFKYKPLLTKVWKEQIQPWSSKPGVKAFFQNAAIFRKET